jgi:hypothetical protein
MGRTRTGRRRRIGKWDDYETIPKCYQCGNTGILEAFSTDNTGLGLQPHQVGGHAFLQEHATVPSWGSRWILLIIWEVLGASAEMNMRVSDSAAGEVSGVVPADADTSVGAVGISAAIFGVTAFLRSECSDMV